MEKIRVISSQEGIEMARKYNVPYIETSAKVGYNIDKLFDLIALEWWYTDCFNGCPYFMPIRAKIVTD